MTRIHLKIDTGMHRQGITPSEIEEVIKIIKNSKNIILEGICSHLSDADNVDEKMTQKQIEEWNKTAKIFRENFGGPNSLTTPHFPSPIKFFHLSASTGFFFQEKIDANLARLGLALYGINPGRAKLNLKPVLAMKTILTSVKEIEPGETVGYGGTFAPKKKTKIATVPAGYFEGLDRRLSNSGFVKVKNVFCPIVGRVSMNITTIDVGAVENVKVGEEAILISQNSEDKNSVENIAQTCGAIPYDILVHIPQHLKRIII
jgi:alanine racemase